MVIQNKQSDSDDKVRGGESVKAVGKCSYIQLVEMVIQNKQSDSDDKVREGESVGLSVS